MTQLPILRKDFDEKTMIGTGPFKFVEWVRNQHLKYVRNDKYFKPGLPYLDELQLLPTADQTQAVNLVISGQVDTIDQVAVQRVKDIEASGTAQAIFFPSDQAVPFYLFMMNNVHPPLDKVEVRRRSPGPSIVKHSRARCSGTARSARTTCHRPTGCTTLRRPRT